MADLQVRNRKQLADCDYPFDDKENYGKVLRFGDEKLEAEMRGYISHIKDIKEQNEKDAIYDNAVKTMNAADNEAANVDEAKAMEEVFKISSSLIAKINPSLLLRTENIVSKYESAIDAFRTITGWKDADEQIDICRKKIEEIKTKKGSGECYQQKVKRWKKFKKNAIIIGLSIVLIYLIVMIAIVL